MADLPRVCVLGAGTSGVICAKVLKDHGVPVDVYEKGSGLGGIWRFKNDNGQSTCYRSLHINTSKRLMELSDFKFREETAEYPTHWEIHEEFERYVDTFDVRKHIRFSTEIKNCERLDDGTWKIDAEGPDGAYTEHYDFLCVANGHHWDPRLPDFPCEFNGISFHAHHYVDTRDPHNLEGKRVVVVGMGNSAMDIACELAHIGQGAGKVFLSQRSGVWIIPKIVGNTPQDKFQRHPMDEPGIIEKIRRTIVPRAWRMAAFDFAIQSVINLTVGNPKRVGLKPPKESFSQRHPTVSQEIHNRLIHGDITPKGNIAELMGDKVKFEDGSIEEVDAIIYATGYNIRFPFFAESFINAPDNSIPLWQRIFHPTIENIAFMGLIQPVCAMMPIVELQSNLVADYLCGEVKLPDSKAMEREMIAADKLLKAQYTSSKSHTIQIDCPEYTFELRKDWKRCRKLAKRAGNPLPVARKTEARPVESVSV